MTKYFYIPIIKGCSTSLQVLSNPVFKHFKEEEGCNIHSLSVQEKGGDNETVSEPRWKEKCFKQLRIS